MATNMRLRRSLWNYFIASRAHHEVLTYNLLQEKLLKEYFNVLSEDKKSLRRENEFKFSIAVKPKELKTNGN